MQEYYWNWIFFAIYCNWPIGPIVRHNMIDWPTAWRSFTFLCAILSVHSILIKMSSALTFMLRWLIFKRGDCHQPICEPIGITGVYLRFLLWPFCEVPLPEKDVPGWLTFYLQFSFFSPFYLLPWWKWEITVQIPEYISYLVVLEVGGIFCFVLCNTLCCSSEM